jgi:hypothetical protein
MEFASAMNGIAKIQIKRRLNSDSENDLLDDDQDPLLKLPRDTSSHDISHARQKIKIHRMLIAIR